MNGCCFYVSNRRMRMFKCPEQKVDFVAYPGKDRLQKEGLSKMKPLVRTPNSWCGAVSMGFLGTESRDFVIQIKSHSDKEKL